MKNRTLAGALCGVATLAGSLLATAPSAHAASQLGGVSVASYCATNVYSGNPWVNSRAVNINGRWDGWRCATQYGALVGVNMNLACAQQYPRAWWQPTAFANRIGNGALDWRCYR